jgi:hypothetical protein
MKPFIFSSDMGFIYSCVCSFSCDGILVGLSFSLRPLVVDRFEKFVNRSGYLRRHLEDQEKYLSSP